MAEEYRNGDIGIPRIRTAFAKSFIGHGVHASDHWATIPRRRLRRCAARTQRDTFD
jgi:hypothetical protein